MICFCVFCFLACASALNAADLNVRFIDEANGRPLLFDSLRYQNAAAESLSVTRLDWLATGFALTRRDGRRIELPNSVSYVSSHGGSIILPRLPPEHFTAISFRIGPNKAENHGNPNRYPASHPLNPNVNDLYWDWKGGYIFMAMEGHWRGLGKRAIQGYAYHFANDSNRTRVTLPIDLDLRHGARVVIALNALKILKGLSFARDGATTHSDPGDPVCEKMGRNLTSAFRVAEISRGGFPEPAKLPKPIDLPAHPSPYPLTIPSGLPLPSLPLDNPLITQRVALGRALFHETAFSKDNSISCASCHQPDHAFSDPRRYSLGVDGQMGSRNSMSLFNLAWQGTFFWDGRAPSLRAQALMPIQNHREMDETLQHVVEKLRANPKYPPMFAAAFGSGKISPQNIGLAVENYLLTLVNFDSKFELAKQGKARLSPAEKRGMQLFYTEYEPRLGVYGADCFHCHGGALFTDHQFHNNGLKPTADIGLEKVTGKPSDRYQFMTPSLLNVALTAPYMHDGRFATLEQVVAHYNHGSPPSATLDPNIAKHYGGLHLSKADQEALVAFLKTLSPPGMPSSRTQAMR